MRLTDIGKLYSLLIMFKRTYESCEISQTLIDEVERLYYDSLSSTPTASERTIANPRGAGRKPLLAKEQKESIRKEYLAGKTMREISSARGISIGLVHNIIHEQTFPDVANSIEERHNRQQQDSDTEREDTV